MVVGPEDPLLNFYAFTLNPNPKRYNSFDPVDQYKALLNCVFAKKVMKHTFTEFVFYPELTKQGNVHIHGLYKLKDRIKYNRWFLPACKQWGFTHVEDRIDDDWLSYIMKDSEENAELFEGLPYPITEDEIDSYQKDIRIKTIMKLNLVKTPKKKGVMDFFK